MPLTTTLSTPSTPSTLSTTLLPVKPAGTTPIAPYCYQRYNDYNAIWGLTLNGPRTEWRPDVFFFGVMGDDVDRCESSCFSEPGCVAYSLFSTSYDNLHGNDSYSGLCYGRGPDPSMLYYIPEPRIMGGFMKWHVPYCRDTRKFDQSGRCYVNKSSTV